MDYLHNGFNTYRKTTGQVQCTVAISLTDCSGF